MTDLEQIKAFGLFKYKQKNSREDGPSRIKSDDQLQGGQNENQA
jgi:hypothetical protein